MGPSIPFIVDDATYQLVETPSGWDIYLKSNWIAWTGGSITDARNIARYMAKHEKDSSDAQKS